MRALVISGGGSKGAFAGGVAQFLIEEAKHKYDMFIGTSTGSLLVSHLALGKITKLKETFTNVNQKTIFNNSPFFIRNKNNIDSVSMNHFNILFFQTILTKYQKLSMGCVVRKKSYKDLTRRY